MRTQSEKAGTKARGKAGTKARENAGNQFVIGVRIELCEFSEPITEQNTAKRPQFRITSDLIENFFIFKIVNLAP